MVRLGWSDYLTSHNLAELILKIANPNAILGDNLKLRRKIRFLVVANHLSKLQCPLGEVHIPLNERHLSLLLTTCPIGHLNSLWDGGARANCGKERVLGALQRVWTVLGDVDERILHLQGAGSFGLLSGCTLIGDCGLLLLDS